MPERTRRSLTIGVNEANQRLDRFLRKLCADTARAELYRWIRTRAVRVNGKKGRPEQRLAAGDVVELPEGAVPASLPAAAATAAVASPPLQVVHEDADLLVVDKPAGVLVHGGDDGGTTGEPTLVEQVHAYLAAHDRTVVSPTFRPTPVHRLDRNTSGLVVFALSLAAAQALAETWRTRRVHKRYFVLVEGTALPAAGAIELPLVRSERTSRAGDGQAARTAYRVVERRGARQLVDVDLDTGRTHQIRAHLASLGAPVLGDRRYGAPEPNERARRELGLRRQALHAASLELPHPRDGRPLAFAAPLPEDLRHALERAGFAAP